MIKQITAAVLSVCLAAAHAATLHNQAQTDAAARMPQGIRIKNIQPYLNADTHNRQPTRTDDDVAMQRLEQQILHMLTTSRQKQQFAASASAWAESAHSLCTLSASALSPDYRDCMSGHYRLRFSALENTIEQLDTLPAPDMPAFEALPAHCRKHITADDNMSYSTREIAIPQNCTHFGIALHHKGKTIKAAMGHNLVIAADEDIKDILEAGAAAGLENGYLRRHIHGNRLVVAATKLLSGGESSRTVFAADKLEEGRNYSFFCTFPGHITLMKGRIYRE